MVFAVGLTGTLPVAVATAPTPLSIFSVLAPVAAQINFDWPPGAIFTGFAVKVTPKGAVTVAVAVAVAVPLVAVMV